MTADALRDDTIAIENRIAILEKAVRSIAANTCCDNCREAALVARSALAAYVGLAREPASLPPPAVEREALERLVAKLELIHVNDEYRAVWTFSHFRRGAYTGPTYTAELENAKAALAALSNPETSAPLTEAPHNSGERLPSSDAADGGAETPSPPSAGPVAQWQWLTDGGSWTPTQPPDLTDLDFYGMDRFRPLYAHPPVTPERERIIEECAKIAEPWPGYQLDGSSSDADRAVVRIRAEIAKAIRALAQPAASSKPVMALEQLIRDLRTNPSGGDDYPFEFALAIADRIDAALNSFSAGERE